MAFDAHANGAYSTVLTAPSNPTTGTTFILQSGDGARFPDPASVGAYEVTICAAGSSKPVFVAGSTAVNAEIGRCTAKSGDTLTITRAQEGTSAWPVVAGDQVYISITAKVLTDIEAAFTVTDIKAAVRAAAQANLAFTRSGNV